MPNRKNKSKKRAPKAVKPKVLANNASPAPVGTQPRPMRQPKAKGGGVKPHHVKGVCSITDPFCVASKGAKWPDGTSGNTLTEQFRGNVTISSTANGNNVAVFAPSAPYGYVLGVSSTATTVTTDTNYLPYKASSLLATFGQQYRIVTYGIIIRCVASATTASGVCTVGTTTPPSTLPALYTLGQELYPEVKMKAIQPGMEIAWICQPRGTESHAFHNKSSTPAVNPDEDWTALAIEITGCPASQPMINVEWYMNIEFTPLVVGAGNSLTAIARPNPPASTHATSATSAVHASLGSFIEGGLQVVESKVGDAATRALNSFLADPLASIAGLFA